MRNSLSFCTEHILISDTLEAGGTMAVIEDNNIKEILYNKYIEPTRQDRKHRAGIEIEIPIVNLSGDAVDFDVVHKVTSTFMARFDMKPVGVDDNGDVYLTDNDIGDSLSYDCSYNNLELSLACADDLLHIKDRFESYYSVLQELFAEYDHTLTGMGVNPHKDVNHNIPVPNERYRMLFHHLHSYPKYKQVPMYFHHYPAFGTFASASQVQLDVDYDDLIKTIRVFSLIEPIKALLFSNSVIPDEREDMICVRDMFWENSTHGINPHNIGMYECSFDSVDELLNYLLSTSIYCVMRDGKYVNFEPVSFSEYLKLDSINGEYYDSEDGRYKKITIIPEMRDIDYLRTFKFEDLTYRGTIEFRSCCTQPIADSMTVGAFHLGLQKRLDQLEDLLDKDTVLYRHGYTAVELRHMFVRQKFPGYIDQNKLYDLIERITDLASDGLCERGFGEEVLLEPLYDRIARRSCPGLDMMRRLADGESMESLIKDYGTLNRD